MKQTSEVRMECGYHRRKQQKYLKKTETHEDCVKVTGKKRQLCKFNTEHSNGYKKLLTDDL